MLKLIVIFAINWYFQCNVVYLNLCKEYLNMVTFKNSSLTLDKELNILIYGMPFSIVTYGTYKL